MYPQALVLLASAALAASRPADDCTSDDALFEERILSPMRRLFADYGVITVPGLNVDGGRTYLSAEDGQAGNFTSFVLEGGGRASAVCLSDDRSNVTLSASLRLSELSLTFGSFELDLPLFTVGGGRMAAAVAGAGGRFGLSVVANGDGTCLSTLNFVEIRGFDSVDADFQPLTIVNWLSEFVLRHFAGRVLGHFGFYGAARTVVEKNLRAVVPNVERELCDMVRGFRS